MYYSIMYRVLFPIDVVDDAATKRAEMLTEMPLDRDELEITILNVFEAFDGVEGDLTVSSGDIYNETDVPTGLDTIEGRFEADGLDTSLVRRHGDPADEILEYAHEGAVDLIVMGGRKRSPVGKALFGSVSQAVLLNTELPVVILTSG
jgi:nucleotide-binding universal stress UspA family protein